MLSSRPKSAKSGPPDSFWMSRRIHQTDFLFHNLYLKSAMTETQPASTKVSCTKHGDVGPAYICRHLHRGTRLGFFSMHDQDDPTAKQGQCFRCGMFSLIIGSIPLMGYRLWVWLDNCTTVLDSSAMSALGRKRPVVTLR